MTGEILKLMVDRKASKAKNELLYKKLSKEIKRKMQQSQRGMKRPAVLIDRTTKQRKQVQNLSQKVFSFDHASAVENQMLKTKTKSTL